MCGISVHVDGTEDEEIHCLKQGGLASDARDVVRRDTASLITSAGTDTDDVDPFADVEEDEDELEQNEDAVDDC